MTLSSQRILAALFVGLSTVSAFADEPAASKPEASFTAQALVKEICADPKAGLAAYKGKTVEVTGAVSTADPTFSPQGITLGAGKRKPTDAFGQFVDCEIPAGQREKGWLLALGQKIKAVGEVAAADADHVKLAGCVVAELEPNPIQSVSAKDLAAAYAADEKAAAKTYGDRYDLKEWFVDGVVKDVKDSPYDVKWLFLEGSGGIVVRSGVPMADVEKLMKGDKVRIKGRCRGLFKDDGFVACDGHVVKAEN